MMKFFLSYNNGAEALQFPVNPSSYRISDGGTEFNDFTVVKLGEATVIGDSRLHTVAFSSFFPKHYDPSYCEYESIPDPRDAVNMIERWRLSQNPIRLIISETEINIPVTIRQFDYEERGGEPGDIYFDISFKEFRFIRIRQMSEKSSGTTASSSNRPNMQVKNKVHVVTAGDTLWKLAKVYLGEGSKWQAIYDKNKSTIGPDQKLSAGQRLVIPS